MKQSETARELKLSPSTLQRYKRVKNMLLLYRIPPSNTYTRKEKTSNHREHDFKMTSNDLKMTSNDLKMTSKDKNDKLVSKKVKTKNNLRSSDPDEDSIYGRDLVEQAFSSQKMAEFIGTIKNFQSTKLKNHKLSKKKQ